MTRADRHPPAQEGETPAVEPAPTRRDSRAGTPRRTLKNQDQKLIPPDHQARTSHP